MGKSTGYSRSWMPVADKMVADRLDIINMAVSIALKAPRNDDGMKLRDLLEGAVKCIAMSGRGWQDEALDVLAGADIRVDGNKTQAEVNALRRALERSANGGRP